MSEQRTNKGAKNIVILILIVIIVILVVAFVRSNQFEPQPTVENTKTETKSQSTTKDQETEKEDANNFYVIHPEEWEYTERAEEAVQSLAEGQIMSVGIVEDPTEKGTYYFSTFVVDESYNEILVSIYSYKTEDLTWERIFRDTYQENEFPKLATSILPLFHVAGYENNKLIVQVRAFDYPPDACDHPLILPGPINESDEVVGERLMAIDLDDPYSGIEEYTPSEDALAQAESQQEACERR